MLSALPFALLSLHLLYVLSLPVFPSQDGPAPPERVDLVVAMDRFGGAASPVGRRIAERFGLKRTAWSRGSFALFVK